MTTEKPVIYHRDGHIGRITLNAPEKRNALNPVTWTALGEAVAAAEQDEEVRVILVEGRGKSFCSGLDLSQENEMFAMMTGQAGAAQKAMFFKEVRRTQDIHTRLERLSVPTIAVIQAHCLGAGLELALCCDIRLCDAGCLFALPEAKLAFITDVGGLQRLPKVVGRAHAREICFRGHRFGAEYARRINLVNDFYPDEASLRAQALDLAQEIASNPPLAVQGIKEVLIFDETASLDESLEYNAARSAMVVPSEDMGEAVAAYMEKRKGTFMKA
ncbi:MAG: enoyl-CoA hydratase/isomerase family protein [Proteobacteria bacterium]|nr:enoyl-CoA hydratase/isomerase family protein [Pseudomonadota bacterium]